MTEGSVLSVGNYSKYTYFDTLTLRPPISDLVKSVSKPKGAFIKDGLPTWNVRPLDCKLPLLRGPDGPIVFSRGKLGKDLWQNTTQTDFMLYDPYGYEVSFGYEPIHDKHLKKWFKNSKNREHLLKIGLVTKDMDVKCTVREYNDYRKYLNRIHGNAINKEVLRKENEITDNMTYNKAIESLQKELTKLKKIEDNLNKRKKNMEKQKIAEEMKKLDCERRLRRIYERNAQIEQTKKEDLKKRIERTRAKDDMIQSRITAANKIARRKKVETLRRWRDTDLEKKKKKKEEERARKEQLAQKAKERWEKKVENQNIQIEKENYLHNQRKVALEISAKFRMKKIHAELACLQEKILLEQGRPTVKKVFKDFENNQKRILNTVHDMFYKKVVHKYNQDPETLDGLRKKIRTILADIKFDLEPYVLVADAKRRLEIEMDGPEEVTEVMKLIIEEAITIFVAMKLELILYSVSQKILTTIDKLKHPENYKCKTPKSSKSNYTVVDCHKSEREMHTCTISFAVLNAVEKCELSEFQRTKNRPPTPVPSAISLATLALDDPFCVSNANNPFVEREKLIQSLDEIGKYLLKFTDRRVRQLIKSKPKTAVWNKPIVPKSSIPEPLLRLIRLTLFSGKDDVTSILDSVIDDVLKEINFKKADIF